MFSASPLAAVNSYVQTNLVSNIKGMALITDPELLNPWDVNFPQLPGINPPVVVADQGSGVATSYQISPDGSTVTESSPPVTIPKVGFKEPSGPTGVVQNTHSTEFLIPGTDVPTTYIFDTLQGTIVGSYANGTTTSAKIVVNNSSTGAEYTGLAVGTASDGEDYIYAANEGTCPGIQVFNSSFQQVTLGSFTDPYLPKGFIPYGVRDLSLGAGSHQDADLFVTYRSPNFQGGAIAEFTNDGTFVGQIASDTSERGNLQSPWGLAFIQQGFGEFSGDLLVGNFSSGQIDAYNLPFGTDPRQSGTLAGTLLNTNGTPFTIPGLRSIHFGPGLGDSGSTHVALLFTAEIDIPHIGIHNGNLEIDIHHIGIHSENLSLYGEITPANVKLPTGMATGTGGISNIQQVNGSGQGDVLDSGSGQDIVIAGSTIYDNNAVALQAIESYWSTNDGTFLQRMAALSSPSGITGGGYELSDSTVTLHDSAGDAIDLGSAYDWFFRRVGIDTLTTESEMPKQQTFI
jgi:uncharacterized protein (TIGR03118 family)